MDWGAGHYETIAQQLLPAAAAVIDDAAVRPEILRDANEDPDGFRLTSRYLVFTAARR